MVAKAKARIAQGMGNVTPDKSDKNSERRGGQRHMTILRVAKLASGESEGLCVVRNISAGGMMIDVHSVIDLGEEVKISLVENEHVEGIVVWQKSSTLGIQFKDNINVENLLAKPPTLKNGKNTRLPRLSVQCAAELKIGAKLVKAKTLDVSQRGVKMQTSHPMDRDERVMIVMPGLRPISGTVRWHRDDQVGIVFHDIVPLSELMTWLSQRDDNERKNAGD